MTQGSILPRSCLEDEAGRMEDALEELLCHREPAALQRYLQKVRSWAPAREASGMQSGC